MPPQVERRHAAGAQGRGPGPRSLGRNVVRSRSGTWIAVLPAMAEDLRRRLDALIREPPHAEFARKLSDALARIRRDFQGEARERLEQMVADTLGRQVEQVRSRECVDAALADLQASQADLVRGLYGVLLRLIPDDGATRH